MFTIGIAGGFVNTGGTTGLHEGCSPGSAPHEAVVDMFSEQPALVEPLLTALGCPLPEYESVDSQSETCLRYVVTYC